jgi:hypothetical protein
MREPLTEERERGQRDAHPDERGRAGHGERHGAIVATNRSHVVHGLVTRP